MTKPRISVNKLGEYITANPARRKSIVQNQKNPPNFIVTRYTETREAYVNYIISKLDDAVIRDAKEVLNAKQTSSDFQANDKAASIEALDCFENINFPDLSNFDISRFDNNAKIDIGGVDVSVNPDIVFRGVHRGKNIVGAIKLHIVKTTVLNEEARKTVATVLHQFVEDIVRTDEEVVPVEFVFSVDVFSHKCESAPKSYKRRRTDVLAACEEYALWWNNI